MLLKDHERYFENLIGREVMFYDKDAIKTEILESVLHTYKGTEYKMKGGRIVYKILLHKPLRDAQLDEELFGLDNL